MNIAKIMVPKALTVCLRTDSTIRKGVDVMRRHGYTAIPVLDPEGKFIGCVNDRDFLRYFDGDHAPGFLPAYRHHGQRG